MRKSNGVPTITITSALPNALRARAVEVMRVAGRQQSAGGAVEVAGDVEASQQRDRLPDARGSPDLLAEQYRGPLGVDQDVGELLDIARIADRLWSTRDSGRASARTARVDSTSRSSTSRGISRYDGPDAPLKHSRAAIETMSATRSVLGTRGGELGDRPHAYRRAAGLAGRPSCAATARPDRRYAASGFRRGTRWRSPVTAFVQPGPGGRRPRSRACRSAARSRRRRARRPARGARR